MRCKACDYPLFNLKARQCPECGVAFVPGDFEFNLNSVQFCCPHCEQAYYGTGTKGHLVPSEFNCVKCGRHISMNEMLLRPAGGVAESQTQPQQMPWLERHKTGRMKAWFSMIGMGLVAPGRLMRVIPESASVWGAWWFAIVTNFLIFGVLTVPCLCLAFGMPFFIRGGMGGGGGPRTSSAWLFQVMGPMAGMWLVSLGAGLLLLLVWGASTHGLLRMTGETAQSIGRTYTAICYGAGANIFTATPCVGQYIGWIWWTVSAVFMVKEGQKVSGGRAAFAVLALPVFLVLAIVAGYITLIAMMPSMQRAARGTTTSGWSSRSNASLMSDTRMITTAVLTYAQQHNGAGPAHALELTVSNNVAAANFVDWNNGGDEADVPVAGMTLEQFEYLQPNRKRTAVKKAVDALPAGTIAHRLGDFVFVHHGIDLNNADPQLWIVVMTPDPDNSNSSTGAPAGIGLADGTVIHSSSAAGVVLRSQNLVRAKYGLAPLPDLRTVTHNQPAVAGTISPEIPKPEDAADADSDEFDEVEMKPDDSSDEE